MQLTKYAIYPFEKYIGKPLTDDELALITVYFGGELKKMPASLITSEPDVFSSLYERHWHIKAFTQQLSVQYPENCLYKTNEH
jgi:Transcriptional antiterminator